MNRRNRIDHRLQEWAQMFEAANTEPADAVDITDITTEVVGFEEHPVSTTESITEASGSTSYPTMRPTLNTPYFESSNYSNLTTTTEVGFDVARYLPDNSTETEIEVSVKITT